jgi:hypothetical protein
MVKKYVDVVLSDMLRSPAQNKMSMKSFGGKFSLNFFENSWLLSVLLLEISLRIHDDEFKAHVSFHVVGEEVWA